MTFFSQEAKCVVFPCKRALLLGQMTSELLLLHGFYLKCAPPPKKVCSKPVQNLLWCTNIAIDDFCHLFSQLLHQLCLWESKVMTCMKSKCCMYDETKFGFSSIILDAKRCYAWRFQRRLLWINLCVIVPELCDLSQNWLYLREKCLLYKFKGVGFS